jgi:hypothetical protein
MTADLSPSAFLSYCQPNEVTPYTLHVRSLGEDGRQDAGGPIGPTLCGRRWADGWDTVLPVTLKTLGQPMLTDTAACPGCWPAAYAFLLAGGGSAADLVAQLVRRADQAAERAGTAESDAARAAKELRREAVNAERYRQLRTFVCRWLDAGLIPDDHEEHVRGLVYPVPR